VKNLNNDQLMQLWNDYGAALLLGAGLLGLLSLLAVVIYARKTKKRLRPIVLSASMNLALLLNAEGMWVVAQDKLHLPPQFAILVFAVFEILFLNATGLAAERYHATTIRDEHGKIVTAGHPGKMVWVAFGIAVFSGLIVASNAPSGTEKMLRLGIPVTIFAMWWAALTAEGQTAKRGRFAYSPRRIAESRGWIIGDDDPEFKQLAHDRAVRKLVTYGDRVRSSLPPSRLWEWRAGRLARTATEEVTTEVLAQLERQDRFMDLIAPHRAAVRAAARAQNGLVLPPGFAAALHAGQTPTIERTDQRTEWTDDADTRPLFEGDSDTGGQATTTTGQTQTEARTDEPDARTHGANGHRADDLSASAAGSWPLSQRDGEEAPPPADERTAEPVVQTPVPVNVDSPQWRTAVERLSSITAEEMRPADGNLSGRGLRHLTQVLAPQVPELSEEHVKAFIRDWWNARDGLRPESGLPWSDLLPQKRPDIGTDLWRAAVDRLRQELAGTLRPDDMRGQSGRGAIELAELLAPKVPELDKEAVIAFIGDYALASTGQLPMSGLPWTDLLPEAAHSGPRGDDELIRTYGALLKREVAENGRLTRYRVERVTGAAGRQADRILAAILSDDPLTVSEAVR